MFREQKAIKTSLCFGNMVLIQKPNMSQLMADTGHLRDNKSDNDA